MISQKLPSSLVETTWLAEHLHDLNIRVIDSTVILHLSPSGDASMECGRTAWEQGHIPGSGFADLLETFSDTSSPFPLTFPVAEQFSASIEELGIGEDTMVVVYDQGHTAWATRFWWLLRAFGFDNVAVLNGGWKKWRRENLPVSTEITPFARGHFVPRLRAELLATKDEVIAATHDEGICLLNALSADHHAGRISVSHGRYGHIPSSVHVPPGALLDPTTNAYFPLEQCRAKLAHVGATTAKRVITYCAAAVNASSHAFILTLLGVSNVAVYDGSQVEWNADPALPLEVEEAVHSIS